MKVNKEVVTGFIIGFAGVMGLRRLYTKGYEDGSTKTKDVYDSMFDMFRELEKEHENSKTE